MVLLVGSLHIIKVFNIFSPKRVKPEAKKMA